MNIRAAEIGDAESIQLLLSQLGYPADIELIKERIEVLSCNTDHFDFIYEDGCGVIGFISFHFIPQITIDGNYGLISYLVVNEQVRSKGVGAALETHCVNLALEKKCKKIILQSNIRRKDAHRFYLKQGYSEYQKTFVKYLDF